MTRKLLPVLALVLTLALSCGGGALAKPFDTTAAGQPAPENEVSMKRAALLQQCPASPDLTDGEAARLPIHIITYGGSGPEVLVMHGGVQGNLGGPNSFPKQHVLAEQGWRLLLPERPGFGLSPSRGRDDQVKEAVWIAGMLGDWAHLIGHSWGGADALMAAAGHPAAVRSLILVELALDQLLHDDPKLPK